MSDDYFVGDDKPFIENINSALLLSNVFDWTVPIELPKMFSNSTWVNSSSRRKAGVSVVTLDGGLPSGVSVSTVDDHSVLTGTGTVRVKFYPNFNVYGGISKISWTCSSGSMTVKVEDVTGTTIVSSVSNGATLSEAGLKPLKEYVLVCSLSSATLTDLTITMVNTSSENRYGANLLIPSVDGLPEAIAGKEDVANRVTSFGGTPSDSKYPSEKLVADSLNLKVDKVAGKSLTTNDFSNEYKGIVDDLSSFTAFSLEMGNSNFGTVTGYRNKNLMWINCTMQPANMYFTKNHSWRTSSGVPNYFNPKTTAKFPCIATWETSENNETVTHSAPILLTVTPNGKITSIRWDKLGSDCPSTGVTVYLDLVYPYNTSGGL